MKDIDIIDYIFTSIMNVVGGPQCPLRWSSTRFSMMSKPCNLMKDLSLLGSTSLHFSFLVGHKFVYASPLVHFSFLVGHKFVYASPLVYMVEKINTLIQQMFNLTFIFYYGVWFYMCMASLDWHVFTCLIELDFE
jgi:hypothetical protein